MLAMTSKPHKVEPREIEFVPDAWPKFERMVKAIAKAGPQHRDVKPHGKPKPAAKKTKPKSKRKPA